MDPLISIIITSKNEEKVLKRLLTSIKNQQYKHTEIILVDNSSIDSTKKIAQEFKVSIFDCGPERSAQRNLGARKAKGKYLLFLDADMKLTKHVLKECIRLIEKNKKIKGIIIPELSLSVNFWEKVKAFERSFYNREGDSVSDAVRFFSKTIFDKIGGYDEAITGPEDWDLTDRLRSSRYLIGRINARIYHYEKIPSLFSLLEKKFYYGLGAHRYIKKQGISVLSPKTIYFLRPVFYKDFEVIFANPGLSLGLLIMLFFEFLAGGAGYLYGKIKRL